MFGRAHDIDKSFSAERESETRLEDLETKVSELREEIEIWKEKSLIPLVESYRQDIKTFLEDMKFMTKDSNSRDVIRTYDAEEIKILLEKLLEGAGKVIR